MSRQPWNSPCATSLLHAPAPSLRPACRRPRTPIVTAPALVLAAALCSSALAQMPAPAPAPPAAPQAPGLQPAAPRAARTDSARALEKCEASVEETLRKNRGAAAHDVQFVPAQRTVTAGDEDDLNVKGAGRYRAAAATAGGAAGRGGTTFTFSCTFNAKSGMTSGVVLREAGGAAARETWQPDMSRISPEACESAVAQELKIRHPRVAQIAFEPDTRRLEPGPDNRILLLGQGAVQRATGMNAVPFSYTCELDARSGRVLAVRTTV